MKDKNKDISYMTVFDMLARVHKNKTINEGDVAEWVAECETDWISDVDNMIGYVGIELEKKQKRALLPCNVFRVTKVYTKRDDRYSEVPFTRTGQWINLEKEYTNVYADYFGIRIDEDGYPIILPGHLQAAEAFCVHKLYYEDYLNNKIDHNRWDYIEEDMRNKMMDVRASLREYTFEDLNQLNYIKYDMVPKIGRMNFIDKL